MKLCGAPGGDVRSPTKIRCGLDFYLNGRKIERFYVSLSISINCQYGMRNFDYLSDLGLADFHRYCCAAEENQVSNPDICAINARRALRLAKAHHFMNLWTVNLSRSSLVMKG